VRHHSDDTAVLALYTGNTLGTAIGVKGVSLSDGTVVVHVAERNTTGVIDGLQVVGRRELSSALAVRNNDRERGSIKAVEEDRILRLILDGDHRVPAFELCAGVLDCQVSALIVIIGRETTYQM
jgi:hypothetical protein